VYIIGYNDIKNLDSGRRDLLKKLLDQTIECAYFIRDLDSIKSFCEKAVFLLLQSESFFYAGGRSVTNAVIGSRIDSQIDEYKEVFDKIRRAITELAIIRIEICVVKLLSDIGMLCSCISHFKILW
jgi:hypothetical protein